jgi:hypothetical protein
MHSIKENENKQRKREKRKERFVLTKKATVCVE